eukprot:1637630-Prymnesium_polylepis.1
MRSFPHRIPLSAHPLVPSHHNRSFRIPDAFSPARPAPFPTPGPTRPRPRRAMHHAPCAARCMAPRRKRRR